MSKVNRHIHRKNLNRFFGGAEVESVYARRAERWNDCGETRFDLKERAAWRTWDCALVESDLRDSDDICIIDGGTILDRIANVLPTIVGCRTEALQGGERGESWLAAETNGHEFTKQ